MTQSVEEATRAAQVVTGGLISGLLLFAVVASMVAPISPSPAPSVTAAMFGVLLGMSVASAVGYGAVRRSLLSELRARRSELRQDGDPARLVVEAYRRFVVIGGGLIEGPGFLALMTYLVTGKVVALGAAGLAVLLLAMHFPSSAKVRRLAEDASR
jgi:hypothetical protein